MAPNLQSFTEKLSLRASKSPLSLVEESTVIMSKKSNSAIEEQEDFQHSA
jgi:hypothetical protein